MKKSPSCCHGYLGHFAKPEVMKVGHNVSEKPPLGTGERFRKLEGKLQSKGVKDPAALAAWIGRKQLGKARFQKLAAKGRARAAKKGM